MKQQSTHRWTFSRLLLACIALAAGPVCAAPQNQNGQAGPSSPKDPGAPVVKPPKLSQDERDAERVRQLIGGTDDEWMAIRPRVMHVVVLQNQLRASRDKGFRLPKDGQPRKVKYKDPKSAPPNDGRPPTPEVIDTAKSLREAVTDTEAPLSELRQRVMAARQARAKARAELTQAQEQLRDVVSVRQEATLIILGLLD